MISAVTETPEASIDELKFHIKFFKVTKFSKNGKFGQNAFSSFCSIRWNFFKQTPFYFSEISKNTLFLVLLSKMIISEVIRV